MSFDLVICRCGTKYKWNEANGTSTLKIHASKCRDCIEYGIPENGFRDIREAIAQAQRQNDIIAAHSNQDDVMVSNKPMNAKKYVSKKKNRDFIDLNKPIVTREEVAQLGTFKLVVLLYYENTIHDVTKREHTLRELKNIDQVKRFLEHIYGSFISFECKEGEISIAADELLYAGNEYTCKCVVRSHFTSISNDIPDDNQQVISNMQEYDIPHV